MRALAGFASALCVGLPAAAPAESAQQPPDRVMARGSEFDLVLSKRRVTPGRVIVQFVNAGEDSHDLRLRRVGRAAELGVGEIGPGEVANLDTRLKKRSRYELWCSLPGHRELGMEATLRTRKRSG